VDESQSSPSRNFSGNPTVVVTNLKCRSGAVSHALSRREQPSFHEFGHALHGLFARGHLPEVAGTHGHRDSSSFRAR